MHSPKMQTKNKVRTFFNRGLQYLLAYSPASPYVKSLLGELLHQKLYAWSRLGYWPQIREPRTFNEKLLHRKLYTDNEFFSKVEDKYRVRDYVAEKVGEDIVPKLYHVTDDPETIPFGDLPDTYVIKPTHTSGGVIFVDEDEIPVEETIIEQCREMLNQEYGSLKGEYWYSKIEPRIVVEERLRDPDQEVPLDYKLFVFHGRVEYIEVDFGRFSGHTRRFYDREWNSQEFTTKYPLGPETEKPEKLAEMIEIAETLAEPFDFIRVDLYHPTDSQIYFGELTVAHGSGGEKFYPEEYDRKVGSLW